MPQASDFLHGIPRAFHADVLARTAEGSDPPFPITRVVNINRGEPFDVYMGRPGKGLRGRFGNSIQRRQPCPVCQAVHTEHEELVACHEVLFKQRIKDPEYRRSVLTLQGKRLGCFCAPGTCHCDIIASWLMWEAGWRIDAREEIQQKQTQHAAQLYPPEVICPICKNMAERCDCTQEEIDDTLLLYSKIREGI
jgi:hypothetical protein